MSVLSIPGLKIPKVLYTTESKYNGHIEVIQVGQTKKIRVGNTDQSISPDSPNADRLVWGSVVHVLKANVPDLSNILVLGLGGGTMQHLICRNFPNVEITSVELDKVMIDLAKQYFDLDTIPNHRVIEADACRVIVEPEKYELAPKSFEAVMVDIYIGNDFPDLGKSGNFAAAVKNMVLPGGLVIFNRIYTKSHQEEVNNFVDFIEGFLHDVQTFVVAGYTNSDNLLIYGRA